MRTIIFATGNEHKVKEVQTILKGTGIHLLSLKDIGWTKEIIEDGESFKENAFIKANAIFQEKKTAVIAEDSGLSVEALHGAPGIYSARYAGDQKSHEHNNQKLLDELKKYDNRKAQFIATICFISKNQEKYFTGICQGEILNSLSGNGGFGYDPIFKPEGYNQSMAILGDQVKSTISHRSKAFKSFANHIKQKSQ